MLTFRFAERKDIPLIMEFTKKLAEHEGDINAVKSTEAMLEKWMFEKNAAEVLFALEDGKEVGYCLFNMGFAAYLGTGILYIDDLFVEQECRGKGYGKLLLKEMARIAVERECKRIEWNCFKDNVSSMNFYQHLDESLYIEKNAVFRMQGECLEKMAKED